MSPSLKLTKEEKQNGKRAVLIPSDDILESMEPISEEEFATLVKKAIPPSQQPEKAASATVVVERVFIAIGLQILRPCRVVDTTDTAF